MNKAERQVEHRAWLNRNLVYQWCETCQDEVLQLPVARTRWCRLYLCHFCKGRNRVDLEPYTEADLFPYGLDQDPGYGGLSAAEEAATEEWFLLDRVGFNPYRPGEWWILYGE